MRSDLRNAKPIHRTILILVGALASFSVMVVILSQFYWTRFIQFTPAGAGFGVIDCDGVVLGYRFLPSDVFWNTGSSGNYDGPDEHSRDRRDYLTGGDYGRTEYDSRQLISLPGLEFWQVHGTIKYPSKYVAFIRHWWVIVSTAVAYLASRWYISRRVRLSGAQSRRRTS